MFWLHERIQRKACRMAFAVLCAAPTLGTISWAAYFHRPWHEQDWQRKIGSELHVRAAVANIAAPRPLERELSLLRIAGLSTGAPLFETDLAKIVSGNTLLATQAGIRCSQFDEIAEALAVWLAGDSFVPAKCQIISLSLVGEDGKTFRLDNVRVVIEEPSTQGDRKITAHAETEEGQQVRLLVEWTSKGVLRSTVDAQSAVLPAWLLAGVMPGASRWGDASFSGIVRLERTQAQIAGRFCGSVREIDTQEWTGTDQLRGQVSLSLESFSWRGNRIEAVQGSLQSSSGEIDHSLVKTLKEKLLSQVAADMQPKAGVYTFDQMACRFEISKEGLKLVGSCPVAKAENANCLIAAEGRILLTQPAYVFPLGQLVQVFCPLDHSWLPATREATDMADKLPLPESATHRK